MRRKVLWLGAFLAAAGAAGAIMIPLDTADLVNHATLVATGKVESMTTTTPDGQGMVFTEVRVRVADTVIGSAPEVITVRTYGGQYGDMAVVVEDQPTWKVGEDVVLFLKADAGGYIVPDGFQGKKLVVENTVLPEGVSLNKYLAEVTAVANR